MIVAGELACGHFPERCRSCAWLDAPYADQLARTERDIRTLLPAGIEWAPTVRSAVAGFRNKAKMVVTGTAAAPVLGLADAGTGDDLADCPLYEPGITGALEQLRWFVTRAALPPYDVARRRGELKHLLVTRAPSGELMIRFVLRSEAALGRIREHLPALLARVTAARVVSVNIHPEHKATLEGEREIVLAGETLTMAVNGIDLHLRPRSFFQTNTAVAAALYRQAVAWAGNPRTVWDLYCGVGGFALHLAAADPTRDVLGIEVSPEAIDSARRTAADLDLDRARFEVGDATAVGVGAPDLLVVNPPRRGIGPLAERIEAAAVDSVLYSSCNAASLARDLAAMPSLVAERGVLLDMFPHTAHHEVLVRLRRR